MKTFTVKRNRVEKVHYVEYLRVDADSKKQAQKIVEDGRISIDFGDEETRWSVTIKSKVVQVTEGVDAWHNRD